MPVYLAYGSNMARARIEARLGSCEHLGVAWAPEYRLTFHKRGRDGSGKCDAHYTGKGTDRLYGILYRLTAAQSSSLDRFEGPDYERREFTVYTGAGDTAAYAYAARAHTIDTSLLPYDWYHAFVLAGANEGELPGHYVAYIEAISVRLDADAARAKANRRVLA